MVHKINHMSSDSLNLLASLVGDKINKVSITTAGRPDRQNESQHNMGFLVLLQSNNKEVVIFSSPNKTDEGVEFPRLNVVYSQDYSDEDELFNEREDIETALEYTWRCKNLLSGSIIRDKVSWMANEIKWTLETDVGVKLKFNDVQLLVMARDSSFGVLEIWVGKSQEWINNTERYKEIHSFDPSELREIERIEVTF
ncbi:hypothetical protein ABNF65_04940 [Paenibacillus larvae]